VAQRSHFSVAGIPVRVEPAFFVIIAILGINPVDPKPIYIVSWVAIAFVSILLHEMGHAIAFRAYGVRPSITLHGFGGLTSGSGDLTPARHIVVSLAGPLSALLLFGLPALLLERSGSVSSAEAETIVAQAVWINIGWSLLNLVPVLPLDGGQVFAALAEMVSRGKGRRVAELVSVGVAAVLGLWAFQAGFIFGALLAAMFAGINVTALSRAKTERLAAKLHDAHRLLLAHQAAEAEGLVEAVLAERPSGDVLQWASELLGWTRLWQGDLAGAQEATDRYAHAGGPSAAYRGATALVAGRVDPARTAEGVTTLAWALANEPPGPAKSLASVAAAGSGQAGAVAHELLLLGPQGRDAAGLYRQLLDHAGYRAEADEVGRLLSTPGWS
jgi:Zn-dependent protease